MFFFLQHMHDFSHFSCLRSRAKTLLFTTAGVKVTFIFSFTRANVIHRQQKLTRELAFCATMPQWCLYGCLPVRHGCQWMHTGVYEFLDGYVYGCDGCLFMSNDVYGSMGTCTCL